MTLSPNQKAALPLLALAIVMGLLTFAPAGDAQYWRGWLFLVVFVGAAVLMTLDMAARDPAVAMDMAASLAIVLFNLGIALLHRDRPTRQQSLSSFRFFLDGS